MNDPRFGPGFTADALAAPTATAVRRRVLRQLVSSLLFEGVLEGSPVSGRSDDDMPVIYRFAAARAYGFGRVRLADQALFPGTDIDGSRVSAPAGVPVTRQVGDAAPAEALSPAAFLREVGLAAEPHLSRVAAELERTGVHDALAEHARTVRGDTLAGADHDALEGLVTDGHRYHPAYKSRVGFSVADNLAYSPEFRPAVRPLWLAARDDDMGVAPMASSDPKSTPITAPPAPITVPAGYTPLAVHPWQWHNVIVHRFAECLADGRLILLGEDPHEFAPTQSIRTLVCRDDPARASLKCALDIVNTSTSRGLAPYTLRNAAPISEWLAGIADADPLLRERTVLLREFHGVSVDGSGSLGCLWREPLTARPAVPGTALHARERDGTPMILPWLRRHGVRRWVRAYAEAVVVPLVHLLVRHGVALETHAQNMSVIHADGLPTRVALKDFHDGVRFRRSRLSDPDAAPVLEPPPRDHPNANSFLETDDDAAVVGYLLDAVLAVNVGELALLLAEEDLMDERDFWTIIRTAVTEHHAALDEPPRYDVFVPTFAMEKLTTRRLGADTDLAVHTVPNPLAAPC